MILIFSEKFNYPFLHVFMLKKMFPESTGFVAMPVTSWIKVASCNLSLSNYWRELILFKLVTGTATKPRLSGNMLPNIKSCENPWSNSSENLQVLTIKLLESTRFASPNLSIYLNFIRCWGPLWCWHFLTNRPCAAIYEKSMHGEINNWREISWW